MIANDKLPALRGNFVLLKAGGLQLLLPQQDVGAAEYLAEPPRASDQPGLFELDSDDGDATRFVAALSSQMSLLPQFPSGRFLLTSFAAQEQLSPGRSQDSCSPPRGAGAVPGDRGPTYQGIVLCWDEVKVLIDVELQPLALPPAMLPPDAPLREFVEFGDEIAFCCTGERLLAQAFAARS